ncbi:transposase [Streptomyces sp. NPDC048516]|uniref:transposase n=1 Tax=Streptomyces sp. NPDC048516 TaxID=3365565 RepID=UPI003716F2C9
MARAVIVPLLPPAGRTRGRWRDHRQVLQDIVVKFRTGLPWSDLRERFGPWRTVHGRFARWVAKTLPRPPVPAVVAGTEPRLPAPARR